MATQPKKSKIPQNKPLDLIILKPVHWAFITEYLNNGNSAADAYRKTHPRCNVASSGGRGLVWLKDPLIARTIVEKQAIRTKKSDIKIEWILEQLKFVIENSISVGNINAMGSTVDRSAIISASREISKLLDFYPSEKKEITVNQVVPISFRKIEK